MVDDPLVVKPGEKALILGRNNDVLYTDFDPLKDSSKSPALLDVVDGARNKDVLRLIAKAMERPGACVEGDVTFRSERLRLRILHEADHRTHLIFTPPALDKK